MQMSMTTAPKRLGRYLKIAALSVFGLALALYIGLCVFIDLDQDELTFPAPRDYPQVTPASIGLGFKDLHIQVDPNSQIHAWYIPAARPTSKVVLFFHGNGYTIEKTLPKELPALRKSGANLLLVDYRGYGSSSPVQANGLRAREDGRAALRYLTDDRHVPQEDIVLIGRSIGTGVAAILADENPRLGGLVLLSPFTDLNAAARQDPILRLLPLELMGTRNDFDTAAIMGDIRCPVLFVVGTKDQLTPPWMAQDLYDRARGSKHLYQVPKAGHNDLWEIGGPSLVAQLRAFVTASLPGAG